MWQKLIEASTQIWDRSKYASVWVWVGKSSHGMIDAISHEEMGDTQGDNMVSLISIVLMVGWK